MLIVHVFDDMKPNAADAVAAISLSIILAVAGSSCWAHRSSGDENGRQTAASKRMLDGKEWTTENLSVAAPQSYCYDDAEQNCHRYGRLYTWESAQQACQSLGDGWRLPTNDEWRQLAKQYGGIRDDSTDGGYAAYEALRSGGSAGLNILLGGGRAVDGQYARLEAHGLYWTASATGPRTAWVYNFGQGSRYLNRHNGVEKTWAWSVRCLRD